METNHTYTQRLIDHFRQPRNKGHLPSPDIAAEEHNPLCGDQVRVEARLAEGRIVEARFDGQGCAVCLAAASILTELLQGRTLDELRSLGQESFLAELGAPIRPARRACALLPWMAFRRAAFRETEWA
jgi:nitrogen fixation NifU-like protein